MTLTEIVRFRNKEPGRGTIRTGVYNCLLTGYVKGTGIALDAAAFGLTVVKQVMVQPVDCAGLWLFDWNPADGVLTILDVSDGLEIETNEADGDNARLLYFGF